MAVVASHLGLVNRDINILTSLFGMLEGTSRSKMEVNFLNLNHNQVRDHPPDIVFVNQDDFNAVYTWNNISQQHPYTVPVFICAHEPLNSKNQYVLKRPIMLRKIVTTIQHIANLRTTDTVKALGNNELSVLVVDDSFSVRKYMEYTIPALVEDTLVLDFAVDGIDALSMMDKKHYDLVFLDLVMPGMGGYKACKAIKAKHCASVVMLTSKKSAFDKVRGTMSGCDAYITKPPAIDKLRATLKKFKGNRRK